MVILVKVDESCIECTVVCRRKRDSVSYVIRASGGSNGENVRCVHQAKLDASHGTTIAVCKENLLAETGKASKAGHFLNDALAGRGQRFDLLLGWLLEMSDLIKKPQDVRLSTVAVEKGSVQAIGHEHVGTDAYCNLIVVLLMKTQTIVFSTLDFRKVDLN